MPKVEAMCPPVLRITCPKCKVPLRYELEEVRESFQGTGPYEVECPRHVITCCVCGHLIDVPENPIT